MQIFEMIRRLNAEEITSAARQLPEWRAGSTLKRTFHFQNFTEAMAFVNRVARAAETANHHPDILIQWNRVTLELTTHDAGGLTERDFSLAREIQGF